MVSHVQTVKVFHFLSELSKIFGNGSFVSKYYSVVCGLNMMWLEMKAYHWNLIMKLKIK